MKQAIALTLASVILLSAILFFPAAAAAATRADACYDEWGSCRSRAFQADEGVIRTTVMLTVCDFALGTCLLHLQRA
jgi:hypothetical protein